MLNTMLNTKKTVGYRTELNDLQPTAEDVASEIYKQVMSDKVRAQKEAIESEDYQRMLVCQKIFEPIYYRSTLTGGEMQK